MKKQGFEDGLSRLDAIIKQLERGDITLEQSIALYDEGAKLALALNKTLETARQKVALITKNAEGQPEEEEFGEDLV